MPDQFAVGDVVMLKSGGPQMTVSAIDTQGVYVSWMDGKTAKHEVFHPAMLAKVDPSRRGPIVL